MRKSTEQVRRDWQTLGVRDPLWAVLMKPGTKNGGWDVDAFLETGRAEVEAAVDHLRALGVSPGRTKALDFGCGAGRTAIALAAHVDEVLGVDVSEAMVAKARALDDTGRCTFIVNHRDDLAILDDDSVDIVYSSLVLQHLPPADADRFLGEMARVVRPGGALIVQVTTATLPSVKGLLFRYLPWPLLRFGQRRLLRYPAPMRMHPVPERVVHEVLTGRGLVVLDRVEDTTYGGHWTYHRYFAVKRPGP